MMTGRIVDSYTNIMTVKLFAHAGREARYAREGMEDSSIRCTADAAGDVAVSLRLSMLTRC